MALSQNSTFPKRDDSRKMWLTDVHTRGRYPVFVNILYSCFHRIEGVGTLDGLVTQIVVVRDTAVKGGTIHQYTESPQLPIEPLCYMGEHVRFLGRGGLERIRSKTQKYS